MESPSGPPPNGNVNAEDGATPTATTKEREKAVRPVLPDGHAASMEGASGVPDRIEEGVEPD